LQRAAGRTDSFVPREEKTSTPGARYVDWLLPGLLGITIMSDSLWGIGFSIVHARLRNLLKRLSATPMRRRDYLLGHALARLAFLVLETGVLLGAGRFLFGVPLHGPVWLVALVSALGALSFAGLSLLVASRVRTIEALSGLMNLIMLPMWIVSGVFFSSANFPDALQPVIRVLPLTALNDALRAVLLEGQPLPAIAPQVTALALWGGVSFVLAMRLFRWR
jgi:ABC-2 type transport system permease protein